MHVILYQNGISEARALPGEIDQRRDLITEQNSTTATRAEENLQQAVQLDPQNKLAMEYLAALYYYWLDPNDRRARLDDAQHWYKRILEIDPEHKFANYVCGVIDFDKALRLAHVFRYPLPLPYEDSRRSLHAQIAPLLDDSTGNFSRALEIDPNNTDAMTYMAHIQRMEAYIADTNDNSLRAASEADEWDRKANQILEARSQAGGQPWPPGPIATISFDIPLESQSTEKKAFPLFPPDPQWMIPLAPPPPPAVGR